MIHHRIASPLDAVVDDTFYARLRIMHLQGRLRRRLGPTLFNLYLRGRGPFERGITYRERYRRFGEYIETRRKDSKMVCQ